MDGDICDEDDNDDDDNCMHICIIKLIQLLNCLLHD